MQTQRSRETVLVGEDELEVRGYLELALKCLGYSVQLAQDGEEVLNYIQSQKSSISAVLLDLMMPRCDGIETLKRIRRIEPDLPVIFVSGAASTHNVVTAMKYGATDFLCKPVAHEDLQKVLSKAVESRRLVEPFPVARPAPRKANVFVANNLRMKEIQAIVGQIGWSEAPVLIQGETGTGKEVLARELHANSPRVDKPFLKLNCAALPSELVESELFGYERGAFTGAFQKKSGMFEMAHEGTIFLDEIGDMDVRLQAKLLQVLQDHEFQRIGGKEVVRVDVRVMAATHRDLERAIAESSFREDLFYRLNVISLQLPPLRDRKEDIVPLAEHVLARHTVAGTSSPSITLELKQAMMLYHWPGNVRELENIMRRLLVLRNPELIARELHTKSTRRPLILSATPTTAISEKRHAVEPQLHNASILEQVTQAKQHAEVDAIQAALNSTHWNRKQAAALLKIDYKALLYKMKKLGIESKPLKLTPAISEVSKVAVAGH